MSEIAEIQPSVIPLVTGVSTLLGLVLAGPIGAGLTAVLGLSLLALTTGDVDTG